MKIVLAYVSTPDLASSLGLNHGVGPSLLYGVHKVLATGG